MLKVLGVHELFIAKNAFFINEKRLRQYFIHIKNLSEEKPIFFLVVIPTIYQFALYMNYRYIASELVTQWFPTIIYRTLTSPYETTFSWNFTNNRVVKVSRRFFGLRRCFTVINMKKRFNRWSLTSCNQTIRFRACCINAIGFRLRGCKGFIRLQPRRISKQCESSIRFGCDNELLRVEVCWSTHLRNGVSILRIGLSMVFLYVLD